MSPQGRTPAPDDQRTGHRAAVGEGRAIEAAPIDERLVRIDPPDDLSSLGQEIWRVCLGDMAQLGRLREPDLVLLRGYCEQGAIMIEAEACVREYGSMMKEPIIATDPETGDDLVVGWKLKPNPAVKQHGDALNRLRLLSNELCLNPLARIRGNLLDIATSSIALSVVDSLEKKLDLLERKEAEKLAKAKAKKKPKSKKAAAKKRTP